MNGKLPARRPHEGDATSLNARGVHLRACPGWFSFLRGHFLHFGLAKHNRGTFAALENQKPGPKATEPHPAELRLAELERENQRLRDELTKARVIIDVQKKVSELLGLSPQDDSSEKS